MRYVYADNAATTPVSREVLDAMMPCFTNVWGNPSSQHSKGMEAKTLLEEARASVARSLGCSPKEIFFTSCGSESDNWAIRGALKKANGRKHIITTKFEHHAVLHTLKKLEREGFEIELLDF